MPSKREAVGRYDPRHRDARVPANGLGQPAPSENMRTSVAIVADPMEPGREVYARVNRRVDILENERSHDRISEAAYRLGRDLQQIFEAGSRMGAGAMWREGDRVDAYQAKEAAIVRNVDIARRIESEMSRLRGEVGCLGAEFLRTMLTGSTFGDYARQSSEGSRRDVDRVADRFRVTLEGIVEHRAARGRA